MTNSKLAEVNISTDMPFIDNEVDYAVSDYKDLTEEEINGIGNETEDDLKDRKIIEDFKIRNLNILKYGKCN